MKFICEAKSILGAIQNMKKLMDISKKQNNILVKLEESDKIKMCYTDGLHSYIEVIDATVEDIAGGALVVEFNKLNPVLQACTVKGALSVSPLEFSVDESWIMTVKVSTYLNDGEQEGKVMTSMDYKVNVTDPSASALQYSILTRLDTDEMFENNSWDDWNKVELKSLLNRVIGDEKDTAIYLSNADKMIKSKNLTHGILITAPQIVSNGFSIKTLSAIPIVDIIGKLPSDSIRVGINETGFCKITDENGTCSVKFQMQSGTNMLKKAFETYASMSIDDIQLKVYRPGLLQAIDNISTTSSSDKHRLEIVENNDGGYSIRLVGTGAGSSVKSSIDVDIEAIRIGKNEEGENVTEPTKYYASVVLKTLKAIVNKCEFDWVYININTVANRMCKVMDTKTNEEGKTEVVASYFVQLEEE